MASGAVKVASGSLTWLTEMLGSNENWGVTSIRPRE